MNCAILSRLLNHTKSNFICKLDILSFPLMVKDGQMNLFAKNLSVEFRLQ